jgi:ATP-binding cassette, subfamily B, bacterial HlyB/CyaB
MPETAAKTIRQIEPFSLLSDPEFEQLKEQAQTLRYELGQALSDRQVLSNLVILILQGRARLVTSFTGQPQTLGTLEPGALVGLASLLRGAPCEAVTASTELIGLAIADATLVELYQQNSAFAHWCDTNLFPAEVAALTESLFQQSQRSDLSFGNCFQALLKHAQLLPVAVNSSQNNPNTTVLIASVNDAGLAIGTSLSPDQPMPGRTGNLPTRIINLPSDLHTKITCLPNATKTEAEPKPMAANSSAAVSFASPVAAPQLPAASAINLGQRAPATTAELIRGEGIVQEGMACFEMLCADLEVPFRRDAVEKVLRDVQRRGTEPNLQLYGGLAAMHGLLVSGVLIKHENCKRLQVPAILPWQGGFALLRRSDGDGLLLASPTRGWVEVSPVEVAEVFAKGIPMLQLEKTASTPEETFGFNWFMPALRRYKGIFIQILFASFVVQLFSLANPLLIQVIIDKVISQRSLDTLQVLGFGLVIVTILESILGSLRTFLLTETTNRIDTRLGAQVIDHLLRLPLGYFEKRPVGELGSRVAELEKIRNFLTGQGLTTVLDAAFSVIYIVVMIAYSWVLTLVALAVLPIQVLLILAGTPLFRRQTRDVAQENARTQSHLVEVLTGIQTVKAQNVEMVSRWKWQDRYNSYISRSFEKTLTTTAINQTSNALQKLSQLLVLWVGATLVLQSEITLGQLIAFRIISGYVTQPLLRLSSIWQSFQEMRISFERLADIIDTPQESSEKDKTNIPLPSIKGHVEFNDVSFNFNPSQPNVLNHISMDVPAGTFVGVVGQSGSGKSTLMKLLPRLYSPQSGTIKIDQYDIAKIELYSLRRQIGIVPQDPLLFAGTVSENIALTDPNASSESIVEAASIACAHEFIMGLPYGYSTDVGERGASLSGGQRQRIAIARTLLSSPKLLVMDEATSALDYDTERRVCENLRRAVKDCTVFFITHRLSTIRNADTIIMMHQGAIAEIGSHAELMELRGRYYALYRQQEAS